MRRPLLLLLAAACIASSLALVAGSSCNALTCAECAGTTGCGYCEATNLCLAGSSSGPYRSSCPAASWSYSASTCYWDACSEYSTSCSTCSTADPELNCGWCEDSHACMTGSQTGPSSTTSLCSAQGWSWESCGPAAECGMQASCTSCMNVDSCGWCAATETCTLGSTTGPYSKSAACPNRWLFDSDWSDVPMVCFETAPYVAHQAHVTVADWIGFSGLGVCAVLLLALMVPLCSIGCRTCVPQPGAAHKESLVRDDEDEDDPADDDDEDDGDLQGCCSSLNTGCYKLLLWLGSLALLGLIAAALCLDRWTVAQSHSGELTPEQNPVSIAEGVLGNYVWLGGTSHMDLTSFTYDCNESTGIALLECTVHFYSGIATLALGVASSVASLMLVLMSWRDLCCAPRYSPQVPLNAQVIQYPFSVFQWRCAALAAVYTSLACGAFAAGSFAISQQYYHNGSLLPSVSICLMAGAAVLAIILALAYRRGIRVTPFNGYALHTQIPATAPPSGGGGGGGAFGSYSPSAPLNSALGYPGSRRQTVQSSDNAPYVYQTFNSGVSSFSSQPSTSYQYHASPSPPPPTQVDPHAPIRHASSSSFRPSSPLSASPYAAPPWHSYMVGGGLDGASSSPASSAGSYVPPPGYVLVPANQMPEQYLSDHASEPGSPRRTPTMNHSHVPSMEGLAHQPHVLSSHATVQNQPEM